MPLVPARPGEAPVRAAAATALGLLGVPLEGTETPGAFGEPGLPGLPGVLECGLPGLFGDVLGVGVVEAGVVEVGVVEAGVVDSSVVDAGSVVVDSGVWEVLSEGSVLVEVVESSVEFVVSDGFELGEDEGFPVPLFVPRGVLPSSVPLGFVVDAGRGITGTFVSDSMTTGA
ncbi:hypothetical protein [Nocardia niwae]|uniref:hypothetical protein n=1 Tax=Nocardia niwae TaxID=626084 RepID=UPI0033DD16B1